MIHGRMLVIFWLVFTTHVIGQRKSPQDRPLPELFEQFKYTSEHPIYQQHSYFNFTTRSSMMPDIKQFGVKTVLTPPYYLHPFRASLYLFDKRVDVDSYIWYPSESVFKGKTPEGISITARGVPLADQRGGIYKILLKNTSDKKRQVPIKWTLEGSPNMAKKWEFSPPWGSPYKDDGAVTGVTVTPLDQGYNFKRDESEASVVGYGAEYQLGENDALKTNLELKPGASAKLGIVFIVGKSDGQTRQMAETMANDIPANVSRTRKHWLNELTAAMATAPKLEGVSDKLQKMYNTGLLSLISTKWEVPEFIFSPWHAACGIDGGAMISYLWDNSYPSKFIAMLSPKITRNQLLAYSKADMNTCYAVDPSTGEGVGPLYSYNYYNLMRLVYDYVSVTGDFSLLDEPVGEGSYLEYLYDFCLSRENLDAPATLIDYGNNHNLLELKKTDAYQYHTPSPNAERALIYDMLTELYRRKGKKTPDDLMARKRELTQVFREQMWNDSLGWPNTLDQNMEPHTCYSIQCFDALRTGLYTEKMAKAVVGHLNENEFLSKWGVHSLSKQDPGYDPKDVDWGGPGVYTGDGTELVSDLLHAGFSDEGLDVLDRILWWGELPYYPQAMRANSKGYREDGRANLISGVAVSMHIVYGLFRLKLSTDTLEIHPIEHKFMKGVGLKGFKLRGKEIDVAVSKNGRAYTVTVNGKKQKVPSDKAFTVKLD